MNYFDLYRDTWNFHKRYMNVLLSDEQWSDIIKESDEIAQQYGNCRFVRDLLLAVINELERSAREVRANADAAV